MPLREARDTLGQIVDAAHFADENTVITKNGHPRAVVVSFEHYRRLSEQLGQSEAKAEADLQLSATSDNTTSDPEHGH